ncbi:SIMPL domain-containing protein [Mycobacterium sp. CBMA271]|uniref:SIMPL domain-containing protein n=1 Tax=unclassified Mycobacteroides TaxID=2618759 RepID=UPI0012DED5A4|nr:MULTISPECIES: SIMPL domain-containing protein [unclassified Mycobacteroides]MUM19562.1 hypothetical protein [Mycobacteroides sp. CBMA 326]MUM24164.1 SIMPL domain-containing protein [Mycobacteroides sp. CBMA 271]
MSEASSLSGTSGRFGAKQALIAVVIVSLALVLGAYLVGRKSFVIRGDGNDTIQVTGSATKSIKSDYGTWHGSVGVRGDTRPLAYTDLKRSIADVMKYLKDEKHVPETAIKVGAIATTAIPEKDANGRDTGKTIAYDMWQDFDVSLPDVQKVTELAQTASDLLTRGITIKSDAPQYLYTKLADLRVEMLAEAAKDARIRADTITKNAGSRVGGVRAVKTGVFQITRPNSTDVKDGGSYDTSTIDKDITAVISMTFGVEP